MFVKINHKPTLSNANSYFRHVRTFLNELHVYHLKQDRGMFPNFALFLDTEIQQTEIVFVFTTSLFVSTLRPFDHDTKKRANKKDAKTETQEKGLVQIAVQRFSLAETASSKQGFPTKNTLSNSPWKRSVRN